MLISELGFCVRGFKKQMHANNRKKWLWRHPNHMISFTLCKWLFPACLPCWKMFRVTEVY